jgi:hypothetical protein
VKGEVPGTSNGHNRFANIGTGVVREHSFISALESMLLMRSIHGPRRVALECR